MIIKEAKTNGFCFGVKKAIALAKKTAKTSQKKNLYIIGDIVHNEKVVRDLELMGIKKVNSISEIPSGATLVLKAHGSPPQFYQQARKRRLKVIDATCPMVKEIHKKALYWEKQGWRVIVFGDRTHEEVIALCGYLKKPLVIEKSKEAKKIKNCQRAVLICQSTQSIDEALNLLKELAKKIKEIVFLNTICQETLNRQQEVKNLAKESDKILIIGSRKSANTRRLYQISRKINPSTFWIQEASNLNLDIFSPPDKIGLISGASTPQEIIKEVKNKLLNRN